MTVGHARKHRWLPSPAFWTGMEQLTYFVLTPARFVTAIASVDRTAVLVGAVALALIAPILATSILVLLVSRLIRATGPEITSLLQGVIRFTTYTGLIFASALAGAEGVALFSPAAAIVVPLVNVISVAALTVHGDKGLRVRDDIGVVAGDRQPAAIGAAGHHEAQDPAPDPASRGCQLAGGIAALPGPRLPGHGPPGVHHRVVSPQWPHPGFLKLQVGIREHVAEADGVVVFNLAVSTPPEADHVDEVGVGRKHRGQLRRCGPVPGGAETFGDRHRPGEHQSVTRWSRAAQGPGTSRTPG